jgi:hypothetical protein
MHTILKEAADLSKAVRGQLLNISVMSQLGIISTDRYYLIILFTLFSLYGTIYKLPKTSFRIYGIFFLIFFK